MLSRSLLLCVFAIALTASASAQSTCSIRTINVSGATQVIPYGINKYGTVVGAYTDVATASQRAFRWWNGTATKYNYPGALSTQFHGNNDLGDIVGSFTTVDLRVRALLRSGGSTIAFDHPGALNTFARGINRYGTIVGYYSTGANGPWIGFRKTATGWTSLRYPNAYSTAAMAISDTGLIVGIYGDLDGFAHGFTYRNGVYSTIDFPGANHTYLNGVNKYDSLVGSYLVTADDPFRGWQRKGVYFKAYNYPGSESTVLNGINNLGDEVGYAPLSEGSAGFLRICR